MAAQYGNFVAGRVQTGRIGVLSSVWTLLSANGTENLANRAFVEVHNHSKGVLAIKFVERNNTVAGDFTTPTADLISMKSSMMLAGGEMMSYPIGSGVAVFGRIVSGKAGVTNSSGVAIVIEMA